MKTIKSLPKNMCIHTHKQDFVHNLSESAEVKLIYTTLRPAERGPSPRPQALEGSTPVLLSPCPSPQGEESSGPKVFTPGAHVPPSGSSFQVPGTLASLPEQFQAHFHILHVTCHLIHPLKDGSCPLCVDCMAPRQGVWESHAVCTRTLEEAITGPKGVHIQSPVNVSPDMAKGLCTCG